ncbi:MAG: hypothetical protein R3342_05795 [Lutibacter sp.]|uniref:hypothetical protein n=1 Tax=Lutibacter sp. TaxID=1925666 RepID=UPI00299D825B|nr:hypothetical protein [Lutibacter sp.]MDX1829042.1 hypothetical protein [Lutibacter sp.]
MNNYLKKISFFLFVNTLFSCVTNKITDIKPIIDIEVNTKLNPELIKSRKAFSEKLTNPQYKLLKINLEKELNTKIPEGKTILINYRQKGRNCISLSLNNSDFSKFTNRGIQISSKISADNNTLDYFVYEENAFYKNLYKKKQKFKLDSGFFYNNIFTLHETCDAFFIIKSNGDFFKYYGGDYFSIVKTFLEKE